MHTLLENLSPQERACLIQIAHRAFTRDRKRYSHICGSSLTSGAYWFAKTAQCFWLLELIALAQDQQEVNAAAWQAWRIVVNSGQGHERGQQPGATVSAKDGNGSLIFSQDIASTDFPLPEFGLLACWNLEGREGVTIMLPSEY